MINKKGISYMGLTIEIQKKINKTEERKVNRPSEVYELKEVQEHLLCLVHTKLNMKNERYRKLVSK